MKKKMMLQEHGIEAEALVRRMNVCHEAASHEGCVNTLFCSDDLSCRLR